MAYLENAENQPSAIETLLNKAATDRAPWLTQVIEKFVEARITQITETAGGTAAQIAAMHARIDQVLEKVQHPELAARRITERQAEEQMALAAYYSAEATQTNDSDLREGYRLLATRALAERAP
jgi:hypothetical protein